MTENLLVASVTLTMTPVTSNLIKRHRSMQGTYMPNMKEIESIEDAMRNCNKSMTEKSVISFSDLDLDPSDFKPHQKAEVHARYLHAKYERDR
ncbi:hypothetical protein DPMN_062024 [Dreissena polymorpha]|uniref:Uncharacterized protein n=1 Tax=Dreissena polymorpha TaxID=45954 RepID=A0A9D4HHQ4_DREPO|nr:hypothetical protein DPMN_062024 [Dreissena polymorpha]